MFAIKMFSDFIIIPMFIGYNLKPFNDNYFILGAVCKSDDEHIFIYIGWKH